MAQLRKAKAHEKRIDLEGRLRRMLQEYTITKYQFSDKMKYLKENVHILEEGYKEAE